MPTAAEGAVSAVAVTTVEVDGVAAEAETSVGHVETFLSIQTIGVLEAILITAATGATDITAKATAGIGVAKTILLTGLMETTAVSTKTIIGITITETVPRAFIISTTQFIPALFRTTGVFLPAG